MSTKSDAGMTAATAAVESEHDAINAMLQTVDNAVFAGASGEAIGLALDVVILFCRFHFEKEEAFMRERAHSAACGAHGGACRPPEEAAGDSRHGERR